MILGLMVERVVEQFPFQPSVKLRQSRWAARMLVVCLVAAAGSLPHRVIAAELRIPTEIFHSTDSVTFSVEYRAKKDAVAALQFDLQYNPDVLDITATAGDAAISAGKSLSTNVLANGLVRFLIFGLNQEFIADGSIVDLTIQVSKNAANGPYKLTISNSHGASPSSDPISMKSHSGRVIVVGSRIDRPHMRRRTPKTLVEEI